MLAPGAGGMAAFWEGLAEQIDPDRQADALASADLPDEPEGWLRRMFPRAVSKPFGEHHLHFWRWVWAIGEEEPPPYVAIWPRGGGKSSGGELSVVSLGVRDVRRYAVYVSATQKQADERVGNVASFLVSEAVRTYYPLHGRRAVTFYGHSRGWRRNRIQTAGGLVVDALGLDTAARGLKHEEYRPDLIILDDIDDRHDSKAATKKKEEILTDTVLPTGTANLAVLCLQNLIIPDGIFARLANGTAQYLAGRVVSGPVPAIRGLVTVPGPPSTPEGPPRQVITAGEPTWEGQGIAECQGLIDRLGLPSFNREQGHEVDEIEGALWRGELIKRSAVPEGGYRRVVIGVDPSGGGEEIGIVVVGMGRDGRGYVIADLTQLGRLGPHNWGRTVGVGYDDHGADRVIAEKNFGGDLVESNLKTASGYGHLPVYMVTASRGKDLRAEPVVALYEQDKIRHVGTFPELEAEQTRWVPGTPGSSPNRVDACLAPETPVLTAAGWRRIDEVLPGDLVLTRAGWKPVLAATVTAADRELLAVELSSGEVLRGTGEHRVWCQGRGWTRIDALRPGDAAMAATAAVAVRVAQVTAAGRGEVWNLEVADQPEYFAAGILVHNCVFALTELFLPAPKTRSFASRRPPGL